MSALIRAVDPNGAVQNLQCDNSKKLLVAVSGAGSGGTSSNFGDPFPVAGTALGAKDSAGANMAPLNLDAGGNLKVAGTLTTTPPASGTSALTNVAESASSVTLLAANANRLAFRVENDSDGVLCLKCGTTASVTSLTARILPRSKFATEDLGVNYTGRIDGIWESAPGTAGHASARVTEFSA